MKRRRWDPAAERRKERVEINLLAEDEGGRSAGRTARGCTLPFTIGLLAAGALALAHSFLG